MTAVDEGPRVNGRVAVLIEEASSLLRAGRLADCIGVLDRAHSLTPADPHVLSFKAYVCAALGEIGRALPPARLALASDLATPWALDLLGNAFTLCHQPDAAYAAFGRAQRAAPEQPHLLLNLATTAGFLGLADEAERAYDRIVAVAPGLGEAYLNRSVLRHQTPAANHVAELRAALGARSMPWQREVHLHYALGKELEDLGDHDAAFARFAAGGALRRRQMRYAVSDDVQAMRLIAAAHTAEWCRPAATGRPVAGPIFILGMPRSGSTLLERALGRHGDVQSLGELQSFGQMLVAASRRTASPASSTKADLIRRSVDLDPAMLGAAYLSAVAPLRDDRPHFIDKLPVNFLYAGLIARALPTAALIHIRREPLDLCMAIFKTLFRDAYPFSYDLAELGAYHRAYDDLMGHWRRALGARLIELSYEDLVADPRGTLEALCRRLGLAFAEACLHPERGGGAVMTASAAQVRRPIHARSVGSAARYRAHLAPLVAALDG